ncbi:MAG: carbohydrate kinase family protein [Treponema sp.]|jgi:fructokinase|nr:carbohydrate kinase family protein [Treponema sp.]
MSQTNKKVLVVGDCCVDLLVPLPSVTPGKPVIFYEPVLQGGGTAANTAIALRKLAIPVEFMGTLGEDTYGRYIINEFRDAGIGIDSLIIEPELNTICVFAFIDKTGERYLWGWPRVNQAFKELPAAKINWDAIDNAAWIHSSGMVLTYDSGSRHNVIRIFKYAHKKGIPTSFDLNLRVDTGILDPQYRDAVLEIMEFCTYVLGSGAEEFYYLHPCDNWRESAAYFVRDNRTIIARMGKEGSIAMNSINTWEAEVFPVQVVDTVGAGDVYNAGFIAASLAGKPLQECILWGNAVASFKVARHGARSAPSRKELDEFFIRAEGFNTQESACAGEL